MSFWEILKNNFKDFTKKDFKSASTYYLCKFWDYLQKFGIWIEKLQRYPITTSVYNILLKDNPTKQTKKNIR